MTMLPWLVPLIWYYLPYLLAFAWVFISFVCFWLLFITSKDLPDER